MCNVSTSGNSRDRPWDSVLLERQDPTSLVSIARERRLVLDDGHGPRWVDLCWVDEVALALIDLAVGRRQGLDLVYPAPAGGVAVLLAAQLLLRQFQLSKGRSAGDAQLSLGLVTADPTMAERTWKQLRIATAGDRVPIDEVFGCYRAGPDGESPLGGRRFTGILIGQACARWPVGYLVIDRLAGLVRVEANQSSVEVFADPLDRALARDEEHGRLIWGWSDEDLMRWNQELEVRRQYTVPFSVAEDRLRTMAGGVNVSVAVARHPEAEAAVRRVREDLRLLRTMVPANSSRNLERGLSAAWHHFTTLTSLPCTTQPLRSVRRSTAMGGPRDPHLRVGTVWHGRRPSTATHARSRPSWPATSETSEPPSISESPRDRGEGCRGRRSADVGRHEDADGIPGPARRSRRRPRRHRDRSPASPAPSDACTARGPGRERSMIGEPSPWDWHSPALRARQRPHRRYAGRGLSQGCAHPGSSAVREAREHWGSAAGPRHIPGAPCSERSHRPRLEQSRRPSVRTIMVDGAEFVPQPDPFGSFASLFELDPLDLGGEGPHRGVARQDRGR